MIITRTPFRVSFFGGGTDYPSWVSQNGGAVISTSIDKYCYISARVLPPFFAHRHRIVHSLIENVQNIKDIQHPAVRAILSATPPPHGLEIHHTGDLPARSGLGSSSAFVAGLLHALSLLEDKKPTAHELAEQASHTEHHLLKENVGFQDQIACAHGGLNRIDFHKDGSYRLNPLSLPANKLVEFENHTMLFFSGITRIASEIAGAMVNKIGLIEDELHQMRALVEKAQDSLLDPSRPIEEIGTLLHDGWMLKRRFHPRISSPVLDGYYEKARAAGAIGGKLLGAGGGGFLLFFVPPRDQAHVRAALQPLIEIPFRFEQQGSRQILGLSAMPE